MNQQGRHSSKDPSPHRVSRARGAHTHGSFRNPRAVPFPHGAVRTLLFLWLFLTLPARGTLTEEGFRTEGVDRALGENHAEGIDLVSAIQRARERSLDLSLSASQHQIEEELHRLSYRQFFPGITIGYARNDTVIYHHPDTYTQRLSLTLEQVIYDRGKRISELHTEEKTLRLRRRLLVQQEEEISRQVVGVFLTAIALRAQRDILTRAIETTREHGRIASTERSLGEITEIDYLSILLKEKDLELEQAALGREEEQILFEFRTLLGCPDREILPRGRIDTAYTGFLPLHEEERYVAAALQSSTELEQLAIQREALIQKVREARSSYLPSLTVQMELGVEGREFPLTQPSVSIGLKLAWDTPVVPFSLGIQVGKQGYDERRRGLNGEARVGENLEGLLSIPLAQMNLRRNEITYERTRDELRFHLKQAFSLLREKAQRVRILKEKSALLAKKIEIQRLKVTLGEVTRLEFLESEIELFRSRSEIIKAITELFLQETAILKLCGLGSFGRYPAPLQPAGAENESVFKGESSE